MYARTVALSDLITYLDHRNEMTTQAIDTSKRVALITGCSEPNSLGAAFSRELLARGWTVFATARNESTLTSLREAGCRTLALDVCSVESISAATHELATLTGGRLDLLINNVCSGTLLSSLVSDVADHVADHVGRSDWQRTSYPYRSWAARGDA